MKKWVRSGLLYGAFFYLVSMILFPAIDGEKFSTVKLLAGTPLWITAGLSIGYLFIDKKARKRTRR